MHKHILLRTILAEESKALAEFHAESICHSGCRCAEILHLGLVFEYFELRFKSYEQLRFGGFERLEDERT